jgi:hypothetical protein
MTSLLQPLLIERGRNPTSSSNHNNLSVTTIADRERGNHTSSSNHNNFSVSTTADREGGTPHHPATTLTSLLQPLLIEKEEPHIIQLPQ